MKWMSQFLDPQPCDNCWSAFLRCIKKMTGWHQITRCCKLYFSISQGFVIDLGVVNLLMLLFFLYLFIWPSLFLMVYSLFNIRFNKCLFYWYFESLLWSLIINRNVLLSNTLISTCHFQILIFLISLSNFLSYPITYFHSFCIKAKMFKAEFILSTDLATIYKSWGIALSLLIFSKYLWF